MHSKSILTTKENQRVYTFNMEKLVLNVCYACDDNYIAQTGISIYSLLINNTGEFEKICIYFIDMGLSDVNINCLEKMIERFDAELVIKKFDEIAYDLYAKEGYRHINSIYAKWFVFRILNSVEKILYIDSDTIVNGSLKNLWEQDLGDNVVAGVKTFCDDHVKMQLGLSKDAQVINDGIVLLNVDKWKAGRYLEKCLEIMREYDGNPPVLSEGVINKVCHNKIKFIEPKYNATSLLFMYSVRNMNRINRKEFYSESDVLEARKNPIIVHYAGNIFIRPWYENSDHPYKAYYDTYLEQTIWKDSRSGCVELSKSISMLRMIKKYISEDIIVELLLVRRRIKGK